MTPIRSIKWMIPGAASAIALTGGWFARKSPPYTVSSKWIAGESPSPFVFTAPLMPPCAQTEWERFTGTSENRSTPTPSSAALIVAIKPASPPPTTINLPFAIIVSLLKFYIYLSFNERDCVRQMPIMLARLLRKVLRKLGL